MLGGAAVAVAFALLLAPAANGQTSDPVGPRLATVTLHASAVDVPAYRKVVLTGRVSGVPAGSRPRIVLRSESVDYEQPWPNIPGRVDPSGRFRFVQRPSINTTYRVALADGEPMGGQSAPVEVRAYPTIAISFGSATKRAEWVILELHGPHFVDFGPGGRVRVRPGSARYAYFYVVPHRSKRGYRVGRARLRTRNCRMDCFRQAARRVRLTKRLRRGGVLGCIRGTAYLGMGSPYPPCGRRVIRLV